MQVCFIVIAKVRLCTSVFADIYSDCEIYNI